jgi:hypothetical protein
MTHIFTRTAGNGKQIDGYVEFRVGMKSLVIAIDGERQKESGNPGIITEQARKRHGVPAQFTHVLAGVALTADEMQKFRQAEVTNPNALRKEREALVRHINAIAAEHDASRAEAWDNEDITDAMADDPADLTEALAKLSAFDTAHPDVKAAIEAEQATATERAQWL